MHSVLKNIVKCKKKNNKRKFLLDIEVLHLDCSCSLVLFFLLSKIGLGA